MKRSIFFVSVRTSTPCDFETYRTMAGEMLNTLQSVFCDAESVQAITKHVPLASCHSEVEISYENESVVGKVVVEIDSEKRVNLDKPKLSALLKAACPWPSLRVEKRVVAQDIEPPVEHDDAHDGDQ
ncbi:hypothetical protein [Pleurochrysis sp. endemic virus 2]|uniref:Uncharacterized protein n=1 Tax=Chrysotila carterae TaxID=13221 RepID=A0A7S4AYG5_CHRCT|nr:hypothetical protein [Pleurochrysis sp. endemic virus 2]|mmetsp:Transcript_47616/g.103295  ORF Transcript_47616/g.103295 Transcript_47616/m.103295 type:complete len:127 (+) Transcript_47616:303-683(+)